ncbi:hypothetical protein [Pedobacter agri]|uniref:hypothetical protein n=1 Tax=Pedobacter agri TaxID=454586 RepID=UPI00292F312D|nr:hypothetical protein [Pedobacter agri]
MKDLPEPKIIETCQRIAIISAAIGTAIFAFYIFSKIGETLFFGLMYIAAAGLINGIYLIVLGVSCFIYKAHWRKIVTTMVFMLANIPLSIIYSLIAFKL